MAEKQHVSTEKLVAWTRNLIQEYQSHCEKYPDSFTLLMLQTCQRVQLIISQVNSESIEIQTDASALLRNAFKHRHQNAGFQDETRICDLHSSQAVESAQFTLEWNEDEYISAQAYMAYICCKLSLRHHLRRNFNKAAIHAENASVCTDIMCHYLPITYVDSRIRRHLASKAALAKNAADPKQINKKFVHECWQDWQNDPKRYPSKAAFSRDMLLKCEHLVSAKKIEDWCRDWEKTSPC